MDQSPAFQAATKADAVVVGLGDGGGLLDVELHPAAETVTRRAAAAVTAPRRRSTLVRLEATNGNANAPPSPRLRTHAHPVSTVVRMNLRPALIELVVKDMAQTLAFYRLLGLDVPPESDSEPHVDAEFGGLRISWDTEELIRSIEEQWVPPTGGHRAALAFECEDPAAVDAAYAEVTGAGYVGHREPWDAFWGMRYAVVHDPDGTPVDFFAYLPAP